MSVIPITTIHIHTETEYSYEIGLLLSDDEILQTQARLMSKEEYNLQDRAVGSIFEALEPGEQIELKEGIFCLNEDLDLIDA